jgi:hypothetical protein
MIVPCIHENLNTPISHHTENGQRLKASLEGVIGERDKVKLPNERMRRIVWQFSPLLPIG